MTDIRIKAAKHTLEYLEGESDPVVRLTLARQAQAWCASLATDEEATAAHRVGYVEGLRKALAILSEQATIGIANPADELPWHHRRWKAQIEAEIEKVRREASV